MADGVGDDPEVSVQPDPGPRRSPFRPELALAFAASLVVVVLVAGLVVISRSAERGASLDLVVVDETTAENRVPGGLTLEVDGVAETPNRDGSNWLVRAPGAFGADDQVDVTIYVPEGISFSVTRDGPVLDGRRRVTLAVTDDAVTLRDGVVRSERRANPVAALQAEMQREATAAAARDAEQARIAGILLDIVARSDRAEQTFDAIWVGRELAPYEEIYSVVHGQILPEVDAMIAILDGTSSADPAAQLAVEASRACLRAERAVYEREASYNESLTYEANEAEQQAAWDRSSAPCGEAAGRVGILAT